MLVAAELLQAFTLVNIIGTLGLSVILPKVGVGLPMIASDLVVGFGYMIATIGVLAGFGLDPTGLLATSAVVSAVLAISLQSTLGNILGGVALQLDGSITRATGSSSRTASRAAVRSIRWRHTVVETRDWSTIIVPNVQLLGSSIMILGKRDGRAVPQRMWVWFNVDFRTPPNRVIQVVTDAINASPIDGVAADPRPNVICMDFTKEMRESFATYAVRYWLTDLAADDPTSSRVRARVFSALRRAAIPPRRAPPIPRSSSSTTSSATRHAKSAGPTSGSRRSAPSPSSAISPRTSSRRSQGGMSHMIYTAGEIITRQGAVAHWLYVLTSGTAEVRANVDSRRRGSGAEPREGRRAPRGARLLR